MSLFRIWQQVPVVAIHSANIRPYFATRTKTIRRFSVCLYLCTDSSSKFSLFVFVDGFGYWFFFVTVALRISKTAVPGCFLTYAADTNFPVFALRPCCLITSPRVLITQQVCQGRPRTEREIKRLGGTKTIAVDIRGSLLRACTRWRGAAELSRGAE